jgi:cell division transport system permease protein
MLTIRTAIYLRRKEIEVMKLVGATDWFVRWPFIVEGLFVGVVGAVVAVLIVGFGYRPAVVNLQSVLIFVPLSFDQYYLRLVLAAMLGFGLLLGSVGSYLGVRRFLKQ